MSQIVNFEAFSSRKCRFFLDEQGLPTKCTNPENEGFEDWERADGTIIEIGACLPSYCPLGACLHPETDKDDARTMRAFGFNPKECSDETWYLIPDGETSWNRHQPAPATPEDASDDE